MRDHICRAAAVLTTILLLGTAATGVAQGKKDYAKITGTDPSPAVVKPGEYITLRIHYRLESAEEGHINVWPHVVPGSSSMSVHMYRRLKCKKGEGDLTTKVSVEFPCKVKEFGLQIFTKPTAESDAQPQLLFAEWHKCDAEWIDTNADKEANPAFAECTVSLNKGLPAATEIHQALIDIGVKKITFFNSRVSKPRIQVGAETNVRSIQELLSACLPLTQIYDVKIGGMGKDIFIGSLMGSDYPAMPSNVIHRLAQPGLSRQQFDTLVRDWFIATDKQLFQERRASDLKRMTTDSLPDIPTNGLIAYYPFDGSTKDATSVSDGLRLSNGRLASGGALLEQASTRTMGSAASARVGCLDYNAFTISLDFNPLTFDVPEGTPAWLRNRPRNILTGGHIWVWFYIERSDAGNLKIASNDRTWRHEFDGQQVSTGVWHTVACAVDTERRSVLVCYDGQVLPEVTLSSDFWLTALGSDSADSSREILLCSYRAGNTFRGYVDNLTVYNRALSADELLLLYQVLSRRLEGVALELVDGSILRAKPLTSVIQVRTSFGVVEIALKKLKKMVWANDAKELSAELHNGDVVTGTIETKAIELSDSSGKKVSIDVSRIKSLTPCGLDVPADGRAGGGADPAMDSILEGFQE